MGLLRSQPFGTFKENLAFLQGLGPDPTAEPEGTVVDLTGSTGGTDTRPAGAGNTPASNTQTSPAAGAQTRAAATSTAAPGSSGNILERLYGGLGGEISAAREGLGAAKTAFYAAAGPSRTYQSTRAESALSGAIEPNALPSAIETARGYVGASYGGPEGLHSDDTAKTEEAIAKLYGTGQALGTGSGLYGLLGQARPALTSGMKKAEAQTLLANPEYRRQRAEVTPQTEALKSSLDTETAAAAAFAKQRQGEEAGIAQQSQDYLKRRRGALETIAEQRIGEQNAQRAALEKLYGKFHETGDLSQLPADVAGKFQTPVSDEGKAAQAKWDEILGKYQDIQHIPLLQIRTTAKGKEAQELPAEFKGQVTPAQWQRVVARQNELSPWFDPGSHHQEMRNTGFGGAPGNYAAWKPLYFNEDKNLLDTEVPTFGGGPKDFQNYAHLDRGMQATLTNQLSGEDIGRLNRINDMLGEGGELAHDEAPFRQAQIAVETERFLNDQIRMLEEQKGNLSRKSKEYLDELHKTRKDFRKAQRQKKWGKVGRAVMDFATFGTYEGVRPFMGHHRASPLADDAGPHGEAELGGAFLANT